MVGPEGLEPTTNGLRVPVLPQVDSPQLTETLVNTQLVTW